LMHSPVQYGDSISTRQLVRWLEENGIDTVAGDDLLKIVSSERFVPHDLPRSTARLRWDLQAHARETVLSLDLSVPADGQQKVIFHYRDPRQVLTAVSAHSSQGTLITHLSAQGTIQYSGCQCCRFRQQPQFCLNFGIPHKGYRLSTHALAPTCTCSRHALAPRPPSSPRMLTMGCIHAGVEFPSSPRPTTLPPISRACKSRWCAGSRWTSQWAPDVPDVRGEPGKSLRKYHLQF
jgi:hypothetical protein